MTDLFHEGYERLDRVYYCDMVASHFFTESGPADMESKLYGRFMLWVFYRNYGND